MMQMQTPWYQEPAKRMRARDYEPDKIAHEHMPRLSYSVILRVRVDQTIFLIEHFFCLSA